MKRFARFLGVILLAGVVFCLAQPLWVMVVWGSPPENRFPVLGGVYVVIGFAVILGFASLLTTERRTQRGLEMASLILAAGFSLVCVVGHALFYFLSG